MRAPRPSDLLISAWLWAFGLFALGSGVARSAAPSSVTWETVSLFATGAILSYLSTRFDAGREALQKTARAAKDREMSRLQALQTAVVGLLVVSALFPYLGFLLRDRIGPIYPSVIFSVWIIFGFMCLVGLVLRLREAGLLERYRHSLKTEDA